MNNSQYSKAIQQVFCGGNISEEEFQRERKAAKGIPDDDVMWGLLNRKILEGNKNKLGGVKAVYLDMAHFLRMEGRNALNALKGFHKFTLQDFLEAGIEKVSISTAKSETCEACAKLEGKMLTVKEALSTMPLPVEDCCFTFKGYKHAFCRCMYLPEFD